MTVYALDPLRDSRWDELVRTHPAASVFHTPGWLRALQRSYGYTPVVYTTCSPAAPLTNGIVMCAVKSWITGRRLVSVPFADHCEPLVEADEDRSALVAALRPATASDWKYVELRPTDAAPWHEQHLQQSAEFCLHVLDLREELENVYRRTHASAIQRKIRRAEREGLRYEEGRTDALLHDFYRLLVLTRRRHNVPPPPMRWFENLTASLGDAVKVRVAFKDGRAIGSLMTLQHRAVLVYKYGCSDATFHGLGTMPFLFWRAIEDAKALGLQTFDLGRSDLTNPGLIAFKEHLGAVRLPLTYFRCSDNPRRARHLAMRVPLRLFSWLPEPIVVMAGKVLYRHIA